MGPRLCRMEGLPGHDFPEVLEWPWVGEGGEDFWTFKSLLYFGTQHRGGGPRPGEGARHAFGA